jgi:hypothetical protein
MQRYAPTAVGARQAGALLVVILSMIGVFGTVSPPVAAAVPARRVDVWATSGTVNWAAAPIFWFGKATTNPNDNYVDVRVAYDSQNLYVYASIIDYYLWYDPSGASDPRTYDAFALYLDTKGDGTAAPDADDYFVVSGFRWTTSAGAPSFRRQGRGTGTGWDETWTPTPAWSDSIGYRWNQSGPNNNADLDGGWATTLTIPWATLGLSGAPSSGTTWGMGAILYDRDDQPPAGAVPNEVWPETLEATSPASFGQIAFSPAAYQPPPSVNQQSITIRRGLNASFVQDAYAGGGGTCGGGIYGGGDTPHPTDNLFVQNESDISDFPCFSKSYLQLDLSAIPAGKVIQSARLTLYQFGNSDPTNAPSSYVQVFAVRDAWSETTLTWNNAPLAAENYPGTWVNPLLAFPGWPGVPATWDVTALLANAYASGQAANLAIYSADTGYNSGKYFTASDTGDWNANGRPTLTVTYGDPASGGPPVAYNHSVYLPAVP